MYKCIKTKESKNILLRDDYGYEWNIYNTFRWGN